ncbi:MAG: hypothetical protein LIO59_01400 [Oscillospiraceae bacterium]|nr:hypothetical protein [Oscillospiraceae bacterium]
MRKLLLILSSLLITVCLCACGGDGGLFAKPTPTPIPEINPLEVLTAEDVYAAINYAYAPTLDGGTFYREDNVATATYRSEPLGQGDPVIITITQFNETVSKETVWYEYDYDRVMRPSAETIYDLGEDAFLAFPLIHIYDRGCHIEITAGSGSSDEQRNLLINLATTAVARFEAIMPAE